MTRRLLVSLIMVEFALISTGVLIYLTVFRLRAEIEVRRSAELGQEIAITFNQPVLRDSVRNSLEIRPDIRGEYVWLNNNRELHIIPYQDLSLDTTYTVKLHQAYSLAFTKLASLSYSFYMPPSSPISRYVLVSPRDFPDRQNTYYEKATGELVKINVPLLLTGKYIDVDLEKMIVTTFDNSRIVNTYEVAAKGNPYSGPTPKGQFSVLGKQENHFSTKSYVWMPWSIHFYSDYFIHEIPSWPNGQPVTTKYSGGCVRMPYGAAEEVYNWAEYGMPVYVH